MNALINTLWATIYENFAHIGAFCVNKFIYQSVNYTIIGSDKGLSPGAPFTNMV